MPDILLFGATGYTGRLTARDLADRGASFAIAGRSKDKLDKLAGETGDPETRVAAVGDVDALAGACADVKVIITCVGPFVEMGATAVEAALRAKVHYIDSTGEGTFVESLVRRHPEAVEAGIAMAPAMGFDEVPGDVVATMAAEGMSAPEVTITYSVPRIASVGTLKSAVGVAAAPGPWIEGGKPRMIRAGEQMRWAPMPPPLGPRRSRSFPLALGHLAPLHLDLEALRLYVTTGAVEGVAMSTALPIVGAAMSSRAGSVLRKALELLPEGPDEAARGSSRWTILGEARSGEQWRTVVATGSDMYGLTASLLATGAVQMSTDGYEQSGILAPVGAFGLKTLEQELTRNGVTFETYAPV